MIVRYGFMEAPNIPAALDLRAVKGLEVSVMETSFFLGRRFRFLGSARNGAMARTLVRRHVAQCGFGDRLLQEIPANRVVELGTQVQI